MLTNPTRKENRMTRPPKSLAAGLFSALCLVAPPAAAVTRDVVLTAAVAPWDVGSGTRIAAWTYNGSLPGPEIRVSPGDTVRVTLINRLPEATTIHWHGVPVPNGMDGVPGVSAPVVPPGGQFVYEFPAPAPGTYWYHPHADTAAQIARGLYGLLIVEPPAGEKTWDRDVSLVIGELGLITSMTSGGMGGMSGGMGSTAMSSMGTAGSLLINGKTGPYVPDLQLKRGERVLFRFVNTGNMVHPMHLHGMNWTVTATDGYDLPAPYRKDTLPVNAGERYDAVLEATNPGTWMLHCHNLQHVGEGAAGMTGLTMRVVVAP
jgi:FtsP/CotA-like multicopper oxidase with cupredoxin domain